MNYTERRSSNRKNCLLPVRLYPKGQNRVIETLTKDIGTGGIKCLSPIPQPALTDISIELPLEAGQSPVPFSGKVAWSCAVPQSQQFYLGISFQEPRELPKNLLHGYIERLSERPASV